MAYQFENLQALGKENVDAFLKSFGAIQASMQTIAVETADFAKKSFEDGSATLEKLVGAKSLEKALEIQTDYMKSSYEALVAQTTKFGELYAGLAKEAFKPVELAMNKTAA